MTVVDLTASVTEYAAGAAIVGAYSAHAQELTIAVIAFIAAVPLMVGCRWHIWTHHQGAGIA